MDDHRTNNSANLAKYWNKVSYDEDGFRPPPLYGARAVAINDVMLVFGGAYLKCFNGCFAYKPGKLAISLKLTFV